MPIHNQVTTLVISPNKNDLHGVANQVSVIVPSHQIAGNIHIQYKTAETNRRVDFLDMAYNESLQIGESFRSLSKPCFFNLFMLSPKCKALHLR
jgi:hypothetical protein